MPPVQGQDGSGSGITLTTTFGVWGDSASGIGAAGTSNSGDGVRGQSGKAVGVHGLGGRGTATKPPTLAGVFGESRNGPGVVGASDAAEGVHGESVGASGVSGVTRASEAGVIGVHASTTGFGIGAVGGTLSSDPGAVGVGGVAPTGTGVFGLSRGATGVRGVSGTASGLTPPGASAVWGDSQGGLGVYGGSASADGVHGETTAGDRSGVAGINKADGGFGNGVFAYSDNGNGLFARGRNGVISWAHPYWNNNVAVEGLVFGNNAIAVYGYHDIDAKGGYAGYFWGRVEVTGSLTKTGGGFRIDHPADPAHKYLNHSFVESSERKNVYDGVAVLGSKGEAAVALPAWVEAANRDFRYQLTPIGGAAPDLHVSRGLSRGRFRIAGGKPGLHVCWQVTGVRRDVWAKANPLVVEEPKRGPERGRYLHPTLHGQPEARAIERVRNPERSRRIEGMREEAAAAKRGPARGRARKRPAGRRGV